MRLQEVLISYGVLQYLQHAIDARRALLRNAARLRACVEISSQCAADVARKRLRKPSHCFFHFAGVNDM
jgi:hypothetical protein